MALTASDTCPNSEIHEWRMVGIDGNALAYCIHCLCPVAKGLDPDAVLHKAHESIVAASVARMKLD